MTQTAAPLTVRNVSAIGLTATCPTCQEHVTGSALIIEHDGMIDAWHLDCAAGKMLRNMA